MNDSVLRDDNMRQDSNSPNSSYNRVVKAEALGSKAFRSDYNVKYNYVAGGMGKGISSKEWVVALAKGGLLGFYGTRGLPLPTISEAIDYIQNSLPAGQPYGFNLFDPQNTGAEEKLIDLFLSKKVRNLEVSNYLQITPALVRYRLKGLLEGETGSAVVPNKIMAKVSRPELADQFLSPPPGSLVQGLLEQNLITQHEAQLSRTIPMVDDICVKADSGGATDLGSPYALLPTIQLLRDRKIKQYQNPWFVRVGAAGGIGTPESAAAAFMLGADFIQTGSINQCTREASTSETVKDILQKVGVQDTAYVPASHLFELDAKVQVVKKGVFFPARANKLLEIYKFFDSLETLDDKTVTYLQEKVFRQNFSSVLEAMSLNEEEKHSLSGNPKKKMALVFKWYLDQCFDFAISGDNNRKVDYQIYCGSAMGAFNQWVKDTELEDWKSRSVGKIAELLMKETATLLSSRIQKLSGGTVESSLTLRVDSESPEQPLVSPQFKIINQQRNGQRARILLIQPPDNSIKFDPVGTYLGPLALEYVAAGVDKDNDVRILDMRFDHNLKQTLNEFNPEIVGITAYTEDVNNVKNLFSQVKAFNSKILTVAGGHHASVVPKDFLIKDVGVVVLGEGVFIFRDIVNRFKSGKSFNDLAGIAFMEDGAEVIRQPELVKDLDSLPFPARHLTEKYRKNYRLAWADSVVSIRTSKGCAHRCKFCALWKVAKGKYITRKPESIVNELKSIKEEYIFFAEDESFLKPKRMMTLADKIQAAGIKKRYFSYGRSDSVVRNPELFRRWKEIGLFGLVVGFEFVRDDELKDVNKKVDLKTHEEAIRILKELDIIIYPSFIVKPDYIPSDFDYLRKEVLRLKLPFPQFSVMTPLPGTEYFENVKHTLITKDYSFFDLFHPVLPTQIPLDEFFDELAKLYENTNVPELAIPYLTNFSSDEVSVLTNRFAENMKKLRQASLHYSSQSKINIQTL